jgi:hypothetical protein
MKNLHPEYGSLVPDTINVLADPGNPSHAQASQLIQAGYGFTNLYTITRRGPDRRREHIGPMPDDGEMPIVGLDLSRMIESGVGEPAHVPPVMQEAAPQITDWYVGDDRTTTLGGVALVRTGDLGREILVTEGHTIFDATVAAIEAGLVDASKLQSFDI